MADNLEALAKVAAATRALRRRGRLRRRAHVDLYNAAAVCAAAQVRGVYHKQMLPNYGVFDEQRYFAPGTGATQLFLIGGVRVGRLDLRGRVESAGPDRRAGGGRRRARRQHQRLALLRRPPGRARADAGHPGRRRRCALVYVNLVGGQDELVFDGASLVFDADGDVLAAAAAVRGERAVVDLDVRPVFRKRLLDPRGRRHRAAVAGDPDRRPSPAGPPTTPRRADRRRALGRIEEVYQALVLGTRDYVSKNGFPTW